MNVAELMFRAARRYPAKSAIICGDSTTTYGDFAHRVRQLAGSFGHLGVSRGDRIIILMNNSPAVLETLFACFAGGYVAVPVNARSHPLEVAYIAENSGAQAIVQSADFNESLNGVELGSIKHRISTAPSCGELAFEDLAAAELQGDLLPAEPTDLAWLFYTSGTTGRPKGVMITHRMLMNLTLSYFVDMCDLGHEDVVLHGAPMTHGSGFFALPAIAQGCTTVILNSPSFDPTALFELIERCKVSVIAFLAPTQIAKMLQQPSTSDLSSLRSICYGGAPADIGQMRQALDVFGAIFVQMYGQGETPMMITGLDAADHARFAASRDSRLTSAGVARAGVSVRVADDEGNAMGIGEVGEICVKGDVVMPGYWNNPEATANSLREGWLYTGDLGYLDAEGYLQLVDRSKDVVITGGNNVYPSEVERVLLEHPAVSEACVFGVPDDYWGESVYAVVVADATAVSAEQLSAYCGESLSSYKRPKTVEFIEEIPKNAYGKIMKRELRAPHWAGRERAIGGATTQPEAM